ncbi:hypothetical protein B1L11_11230 [Microbispora sp. GKU 823]|nr:hypothetical protein B1L11_11230 [Microbispora sp. GKU 823]
MAATAATKASGVTPAQSASDVLAATSAASSRSVVTPSFAAIAAESASAPALDFPSTLTVAESDFAAQGVGAGPAAAAVPVVASVASVTVATTSRVRFIIVMPFVR